MKITKKSQTQSHQKNPVCKAIKYPMGDSDINGAVIHLSGRFPTEGRVVNTNCKEMAYIIDGNVTLVLEGKKYNLEKEDLVLIEPNEKYYWEGNVTMFVPCTPSWTPEQHVEVD